MLLLDRVVVLGGKDRVNNGMLMVGARVINDKKVRGPEEGYSGTCSGYGRRYIWSDASCVRLLPGATALYHLYYHRILRMRKYSGNGRSIPVPCITLSQC